MNVYFKIFYSQIQPILLYGSEVWGFKEYYALKKVHLLACKKFLNVSVSTPTAMVYGECGRYPLHITSYCRCLKYWCKIITMPRHRLPTKTNNMRVYLDEAGKIVIINLSRCLNLSHIKTCLTEMFVMCLYVLDWALMI